MKRSEGKIKYKSWNNQCRHWFERRWKQRALSVRRQRQSNGQQQTHKTNKSTQTMRTTQHSAHTYLSRCGTMYDERTEDCRTRDCRIAVDYLLLYFVFYFHFYRSPPLLLSLICSFIRSVRPLYSSFLCNRARTESIPNWLWLFTHSLSLSHSLARSAYASPSSLQSNNNQLCLTINYTQTYTSDDGDNHDLSLSSCHPDSTSDHKQSILGIIII